MQVIRICRSSLQGRGSSHERKKSQCEISSLRALSILTGREVRKTLEIAAFISLVKSNATGAANENDTHFAAKRCSLFAETTERAKIC